MKRIVFLFFALFPAVLSAQQPYAIYPVPHDQQPISGKAGFTSCVNIVPESGIDEVTVERACRILSDRGLTFTVSERSAKGKTNLLLGIGGSGELADREADRQGLDRSVFSLHKYDRHIVSLAADGKGRAQLLVLGEHTDAVFCGLATVEQMLDRGTEGLPCVRFYDYADLRSRGVIEGYYGVPYSMETTEDLFRFMARFKMNVYMYGAKSDPYHTRFWDEPYPETLTPEQQSLGCLTKDMMRDMARAARASKVNFIWAVHPGNAFISTESTDVIDRIMTKFGSMHELGVRQFGVFVDDVGVPYDKETQMLCADRLAELQDRIDRQWNGDAAVTPADTVKPLQYVPQLYAYSWTDKDRARGFFESLSGTPEKIDIYITGAKVWTVPNTGDLDLVSGWTGRNVAWWWNYPCNDVDVTKLFPMDMYTNFRDETHIDSDARLEPDLTGAISLLANPMQQGAASKIALFSVGDYAWNNAAFDNAGSWTAALSAMADSRKAAALKRVLPYLRYYDGDALAELTGNFRQSVGEGRPQPLPLRLELESVLGSCRIIDEFAVSPSESDRLFHKDIHPWLSKLGTMLQMAVDLLDGKDVSGYPDLETDDAFRFRILKGMGDRITLDIRTAEPAAQILRPFIGWLQENSPLFGEECCH